MASKFAEQAFIISQYLLPQHTLSRLVGKLASSESSMIKDTFIKHFAKKFDIDMSEAAEPDLSAYSTFNDFFTRALKDGARPIDSGSSSIVSPADGEVSECGKIKNGQLMQAKGQQFSLHDLLGGQHDLTETFANGQFATIYLSPRDYHRVHMPFKGTLRSSIYVPGQLFSVNHKTARNVPGLFARNERLVCIFDTENGPMALVLVGAMIVAGIETVWDGQVCPLSGEVSRKNFDENGQSFPVQLEKGAEMGRFKLGSTAIIVTPDGSSHWIDDFKHGTKVKMGEKIGDYIAN
jgi:phosphatidylserine decarboxylase